MPHLEYLEWLQCWESDQIAASVAKCLKGHCPVWLQHWPSRSQFEKWNHKHPFSARSTSVQGEQGREWLEERKKDARRQLMFNLGKCTQRDAPGDRPWSRRVFWLARKRVNPPRARLITANWMRCEQSVLTLPLSGNMRMRCGRKRKTKTDARTATTTATTATRTKPKLTRKYCRHISTENWYAPSLTLPPPHPTFPRCLAKSLRVWRDAGKSFKHSPLRASPAPRRTAPPHHDSLWVRTLKLD